MPEWIKNKVNIHLKDQTFLIELKKILTDNLTSLSFGEYNSSKVVLKNKLKSIYKNSDFVYPKSYFVWDTNWYLDFNDTLKNIQTLYEKLELKDFNEKFIQLYYKMWIQKIDEIKREKVNNSHWTHKDLVIIFGLRYFLFIQKYLGGRLFLITIGNP